MRRRHTLVLAAVLAFTPTAAYACDGPGDVDGGFFDNSVIVLCLTEGACPGIGGPR